MIQDDSEQHISSPARIQAVLNEIHRDNLLLGIILTQDGRQRHFYTRILRIERLFGNILLQPLQPPLSRVSLTSATLVAVTCKTPRGRIRFNALLSRVEDETGAAHCQLTLPERLRHRQLRSFFRVPLERFVSQLALQREDGSILLGQAGDFSLGGAQCLVSGMLTPLREGEILPHCHLQVEGLIDFAFSGQVCRLSRSADGRWQVGLKFLDLSHEQIREIRSAISRAERLLIHDRKVRVDA